MGNPLLRGLHDGCSHIGAGSLRVTYLDGCIPISFLKVVIQAIPISPAVVPYGTTESLHDRGSKWDKDHTLASVSGGVCEDEINSVIRVNGQGGLASS